jgi:hypothetical protein
MTIKTFGKQPYEKFYIAGEFKKVLASSETLQIPISASAVVVVDEVKGADSTSEVIAGSAAISGTQVVCQVHQGGDGSIHQITIKTETSDGNKWEVDALMEVDEI